MELVDSPKCNIASTRVNYIEILQEQSAGLVIFSFNLSAYIPNVEVRIFFDLHKKRVYRIYIYIHMIFKFEFSPCKI